jgi:hypothetical protein
MLRGVAGVEGGLYSWRRRIWLLVWLMRWVTQKWILENGGPQESGRSEASEMAKLALRTKK